MNNATQLSGEFSNRQRTTFGVLVHLIGLVFGGQVFGFISVGVVYLIADDSFTKANARNALNWWLVMFAATIVVVFIAFVLGSGGIFSILTIIAGSVLGFFSVIFSVWATYKAFIGDAWEYPLIPNLI